MSRALTPPSRFFRPLDTVLGGPANVRVLRVLAEHGGPLSAPAIAQQAKLTRQGAWVALTRLAAFGVVDGTGTGRAVHYTLRRNHPLVPPLATLFATESQRVDRVFEVIREAAKKLRPAPIAVWLFGSAARGEDAAGSDLDLAVIVPNARSVQRATEPFHQLLGPLFDETMTRLSISSMSLDEARELARTNPRYWRNLRRDAVPLVGAAPDELIGD